MTDKIFTKKLAKLNSMLFDCIVLAEDIINTEQSKYLKSLIDGNDERLTILQELYDSYKKDGVCDCNLHEATLFDITRLVEILDRDTTEN